MTCILTQLIVPDVTNPNEVDFDVVGDEYKRATKDPEEVDFDVVGDEYK